MAFSLWCLYRGNKPDVKFVSFDDVTATSSLIEMSDVTIEPVKNRRYKGYKGIALGFFFDLSLLNSGDSICISSITLSVNGENTFVNFNNPIKYTEIGTDSGIYSTDAIFGVNTPVVAISDGDELVYPVRFVYLAYEDIVVNGFEFNDYYDITKSEICIDDTSVGSINDVFPVKLKKDSKISINMDITLREGYEKFSEYLFDAFLYLTDSSGEDKVLVDTFAIQAIGNYDDYCSMIDYLLESRR